MLYHIIPHMDIHTLCMVSCFDERVVPSSIFGVALSYLHFPRLSSRPDPTQLLSNRDSSKVNSSINHRKSVICTNFSQSKQIILPRYGEREVWHWPPRERGRPSPDQRIMMMQVCLSQYSQLHGRVQDTSLRYFPDGGNAIPIDDSV